MIALHSFPPSRLFRNLAAQVAASLAFAGLSLVAAPFTPGNVVVYRIGDGAAGLLNTGAAVFLDEYTATGTLVQSVALPTTVSGANKRVVASGTATSEGLLTRSADGRFLIATGYDSGLPAASSISGTTAASVNRVIARIDGAGNIDSSTALSDAATANNLRSAASVDGTKFWLSGGAGGARFASLGATTSTQVNTGINAVTNLRQLGISAGQLFVTTGSGTAYRLGAIGTGLPEAAGAATTGIPGFPTSGGSPYGFFFADLSGSVPGDDTLYVADDSALALTKYSLISGSWTANGTIGVDADDYRGITGVVSGSNVTLFLARKGGSAAAGGGELVTISDTSGHGGALVGTPTVIATASTNTAFRGVALAPQRQVRLLITEVQSSQASSGKNDFWELTNIGADAVDLSNWKWDDDSRNPADAAAVTIPAGTVIAPGESIVFTGLAAATFRTWWGIASTVQVVSTGAAPGLGSGDAVALFDAGGLERAFFSYAAGGFTKSDGSPSATGHAGAAAGGSATASAIWDPVHGTTAPRYKAAVSGNTGAFVSTESSSDVGSPGFSGFVAGGGPSITLTMGAVPTSFSESATNPASVGTVSRSGATTGALEVTLSSSDATEATVPATVTIPDGQASANFNIAAVNDTFPDGNKTVTLTATATGANPGLFDLTVQDDGDVLDTSFFLTEIQSNQSAGKPVTANDYWELTNISASTKDISGYSWHDNGRSGASASAYKLPAGSSIAPGESVIFTAMPAADFRLWWNLPPTVQVFQSVGAPGLGSSDGVSFFDAGQNELFFFSYAAAGFTKEDGLGSLGGHAGPSGGGSADSQALIWVPASGTATPRYTAATGAPANHGSFTAVLPAADLGSPGTKGVTVPTVNLSNNSAIEGNSGSTPLSLTVTRSDTTTAFTVDYAVTGGTATSGTDYAVLASGTLTFTAGGAATQSINLSINGDTDPEPGETVVVSLSNVVSTTGSTIIGTANGTATILNDDVIAPNLTLKVGGSTIATGGVTTLRVAATGFPAPTLQWYQGNKGDTSNPVGGATFPTLLTGPLAGTTNFWVRASNGSIDFDSDTITVNVVPPITSVDLSNYVRIGRHSLPEPLLTPLPAGTPTHNLLCQEASGVAYNWDTDTLFIVADGGRSVTQVSKTGVLIDTMTLALGSSPQGTDFYDIEGIAYVGGGQFVMSEERDRQLVKFTYAAGTTLTRALAQTVKLATFVDNTGTEGLTNDPLTTGFVVLKEISPIGIFQTTVNFTAGTASNGSPTTANSTNLFDPALLGMTDVADVFALSNLPSMAGQAQQGNLIVLSQEDGKLVNIDRSGVISSSRQLFSDPGNALSVSGQQHEGVAMDAAGFLYIVNENGGGGIDFPQLWVYAPATAPNTAPTGLTINGAVNSIMENSDTGARVPLGDIVALDDGLGVNDLSLSGTDAAFFEIVGTGFFLKSGVILDFETKGSYNVTINVNDTTVGTSTPDASLPYTLTVLDQNPETTPPPALLITEVAPWSNSGLLGSDWFEVTNISANTVTITGWKMDDSSASFGSSVALNGITSIAPGESVIFIETADLPGKSATFRSHWFGTSPPAGLQIGSYTGSGVGLSASGDGVYLFDSAGLNRGGISFGASPAGPQFPSFDNTAGLFNLAVSRLSLSGVNGAFNAKAAATETGSPGYSAPGKLIITEVAPWSSGNSPVGADWFEVTNIGAGLVDLSGWRVDDSSESPAAALALVGVGSVAPGESVIFIESSTPATTVPTFLSNWFGASPPAGLKVGTYSGSGIGLSTGGDAVNLFDPTNVRRTNVAFGASPVASPFGTFDNSAKLEVAIISQLSVVGTNGAFVAANSSIEIGSPGVTNKAPEVGGAILTQAATSGSAFSLVVPVGTFTDPEGQPLTYSATRGDGSPLPAWLSFNGPALTFSGTPGPGDAGNLVVKIIATDGGTPGLPSYTTFTIQVAPPAYAPGYTSSSIDVLTPNTGIWNPAGVTVNGTQLVNLGLQGVGRVPANSIDPVTGESIGSVSDLQISGWKKNPDGSYAGTFHFLPDRGYNSGAIFSNYAARLNDFTFTFTPYTGAAPTTLQNQIAMTFGGSRRFTYDHDGSAGTPSIFTTGLLATGKANLFGTEIPTVTANTTQSDGTFANRLTVDAEGLILDSRPSKAGSGWVSDEYGPYIYHFNASGQIDGQVQLPAALVPHNPVGTTTFSTSPANLNGRRENQGMEGIAQSPDGTRLFALLQSATLQDSTASGNQGRFNTRLLVYDISTSDTPGDPIAQYVIQLPRIDTAAPAGVDRTGAQSAILALNDHQILVLSRDGNGRGASGAPVFKSVLLAELNGATNIDGTYDAEAAAVAPLGVLNALVTPLSWTEALNMLGKIDATTLELSKFNLNLAAAPGDINSLSEKWEALAMVSANDAANPNDYFLFIGNDNDFASQTGVYKDAAGVNQAYNAGLENDTVVLAYRVRMTGPDNQAPFNKTLLTDQSVTQGGVFSLQFPADTFLDPEGQALTYSATRADGSPLPTWLTFNPGTRTFSGTPGPGDVGDLVIRLIATDNGIPPLLRTTTFTINVAEQLPPPSLLTGPSTTVAPYLTSHLPGVSIQSLLTVGDGQTVPKVGGGTTRLVGIPDGLGAYDNGDGTFTILMNHEVTNTQGITRAHGSVGSFVSKWVVNKTTKQVVSGDDLIKQVFNWNGSAYALSGSPFAFDRLCSADLPAATALFNSGSGNGSSARLYLNGEETSGGRAFAHVVDGPDAGKSYHLAHFGFTNFENVVLSPKAQDKTIAIMTNDSGDGEVFVYIGTKNNTGTTEPEKAGLAGGTLYGLAVPGKPFELAVDASLAVGPTETFTLASIGGPGNYPTGGTDTNNRATTAGVLQLGGPEDGAWDTRPGFEDTFYFVTKGTSSNGINAPTRLWKMEFADISQPENGGVLSILLDGPDLRLGSLDNMTFDNGKLLIQEDLGDDERLSKIWEYDVTTGELQEVAEHRGNFFYTGGANFLTINEESSGIIPLRSILGAGWYAASVQVHSNSHIASGDRTELVEGGQLVLLNLNNRERDLVRTPLVEHGDTWKYDATGTDPGATWKNVGFGDGGWSSGPSMLGYGDDIETQTDIVAPGTPTTRPAATYYRTTFDVANPASTILLDLYMKWDDGAVVYINGVEVARPNMSRNAAITHTTFATVNDPAERDWKPVSIPCENLNLQATGNVLAISIHQENASSSDTRIDAELFAWSKSPDPGTASALPTGLAVSNPTNNTLDLDWNAQSDAKFFVIERQKTGELTWQVVAEDVPGTFTGYTDLALTGGATYSYRIWAVNQHGASACTAPQSGTTTNVIIPRIFFEDFSTTTNSSQTGSFTTETGIRTQSLAANRNWYVAGPFGTIGKVANGNGFGSSPAVGSDEWMFLPPLNTDFFKGELFSFLSDARFNDTGLAGLPATSVPTASTGLDVLLSTNYDPAIHTDPRTATWTLLNPQAAFDTDFSGFGSGVASGNIDLTSLQGIATIAFRYRSSGAVSNAARHWEVTDLQVLGSAGIDFEISTGLAPFTQISSASSLNWSVATMAGLAGARANNFGADAPGDDWLISPAFASVFDNTSVSFDYYERFADLGAMPQGKPLAVLVSTNYNPAIHTNPSSATWTEITPTGLDGSVNNAWKTLSNVPLGLTGTNWNVHVAFRYQSSGTGSNATKQIGIDKVAIGRGGGPLGVDFNFTQTGNESTFTPSISGGTEPYTVSWNFGDSATATGDSPSHIFANNGSYTVTVTVTDAAGASTTATKNVVTNFTEFAIPAKAADLRVATFNTAMNSDDINGNAGDANAVANALASGTHPSIKKVAEVIQRLNPDVVLLNEVDLAYTGQNFDAAGTLTRVDNFRTKYLGVAQAGDTTAVTYPYHYIGGTNTGLSSGYDLRNQGGVDTTPGDQGYGDDSFGFGQFPGKYGFVVLSKYPIDTANARTFQKFLWKDMPGALLPEDPADTDGNSSTASFYTPAELNVFRLSSKSHWDVPVLVGGQKVHLLCSHPTPPVFDDGETLTHGVATGTPATKADWNGLRNNDEIRFWADYINPAKDDYIYDDSEVTVTGTDAAGNQLYIGTPTKQGLGAGESFVIVGDLNADPVDGDSSFAGITSLTTSAFVDTTITPQSTGSLEQVPGSFNNRAQKTSSFNLRADYALPSVAALDLIQAGVHWPKLGDATSYLLAASDHRSVWVDLDLAGQITIDPIITGGVGGSVTGGGTYAPGSTATFTAVPASGYEFAGWTVNGAPAGTTNPLNVSVSAGLEVEATFITSTPKPDLAVGRSLGTLVGVEAYGAAATQEYAERTPTLAPVRATVAAWNRGGGSEVLVLRATKDTSSFRTTYLSGGSNITAKLLLGKYETPALASGDTPLLIQATVVPSENLRQRREVVTRATTPRQGMIPRIVVTILDRTNLVGIRAKAKTDPTKVDAARLRVSTR
jgi:uncharacterized protein YjiK